MDIGLTSGIMEGYTSFASLRGETYKGPFESKYDDLLKLVRDYYGECEINYANEISVPGARYIQWALIYKLRHSAESIVSIDYKTLLQAAQGIVIDALDKPYRGLNVLRPSSRGIYEDIEKQQIKLSGKKAPTVDSVEAAKTLEYWITSNLSHLDTLVQSVQIAEKFLVETIKVRDITQSELVTSAINSLRQLGANEIAIYVVDYLLRYSRGLFGLDISTWG